MRAAQITVTVYGPDPRTALARLFEDLLSVVDADDDEPLIVQARVATVDVVHAPEPPLLDRLDDVPPRAPEDRYVAEGKLWCHRRRSDARPPRLGGPKVYVALTDSRPALPDSDDHDGGDDG